MRDCLLRSLLCALVFHCAGLAAGREYAPISAAKLARLQSHARIDFADLSGEMNVGWFAANADASEFILFDRAGLLYRVSAAGIEDSWTYIEPGSGQLFSLIDAVYIGDEAHALYRLDAAYFVNERRLAPGYEPVALYLYNNDLMIEALDDMRRVVIRRYSLDHATGVWRFVSEIPLPAPDPQSLAVRIGRIDYPALLFSSLEDGALTAFRFPDAFATALERDYKVTDGPAVFGAVNGAAGSHFAWSDPASARLHLLDLETGENRVVAETGGAYAQYYLLSSDASAILIVNLDFAPEVFAWDVETGRRYDLGPYRKCERIPDKAALSADGTALIIGCDTGLDIWRVSENEDSEES